MARVVLENVSKVFKGPKGEPIYALRNATLTVEDREFVVLVGPSGCGKTTTLRLIAGLEEVTCGTVLIDGRVVNDVAPKDRDVAMVFQNCALYPHMTVQENLAFGLRLRKYPKAEIERRVRQTAELLGLTPLLPRLPRALSGGERQRAAVGRAMVRQPKAFLFDEPLSNLDAQMRVQMRLELKRLHERLAATMIYVTHDQVEAMTLADRIVVMRDGQVQQVADPLHLYHQPANRFVAGFVGSPPMNFFRGAIETENGGCWFRSQRIETASAAVALRLRVHDTAAAKLAPYVGRAVVLGLRPENVAAVESEPAAPRKEALSATVELVEPTGTESHLYLHVGGHRFVARWPASPLPVVGQSVCLRFVMEHAHYFDPQSEAAIFPVA